MRFKWLLILILSGLGCYAQLEPVYYHYTVENGLASNTIYAFRQLQDGRMIIGHELGMSFYNGRSFQHPHATHQPTALYRFIEFNRDTLLGVSFQGKCYMFNEHKVALFDTTYTIKGISNYGNYQYAFNNQHFYKLEDDLTVWPIINLSEKFTIVYCCQIFDNKLYVGGSNEHGFLLVIYSLQDYELLSCEKLNFSPDFYVLSNELYIFDFAQSILYQYDVDKMSLGKSVMSWPFYERINCMYSLSNGNYLVGTNEGLRIYQTNWILKAEYFNKVPISKAYEDVEGNVWIGTLNDGIYFIPFIEVMNYNIKSNWNENHYISNSIMVDSVLILGTFDGQVRAVNSAGKSLWELNLGYKQIVQAMYHDPTDATVWLFCKDLIQINARDGRILQSVGHTSTKSIDKLNDWLVCGTSFGITSSKNDFMIELEYHWVRNVVIIDDELALLETNKGIIKWSNKSGYVKKIQHPKNLDPEFLLKWNEFILAKYGEKIYKIVDDQLILFEWQPGSFRTMGKADKYLYALSSDGGFFYYDGEQSGVISKYEGLYNFNPIKLHFYDKTWICVGERDIRYIPANIKSEPIIPQVRFSSFEGTFKWDNGTWVSDFEGNSFHIWCQLLPNLRGFGEGNVSYRIKGVVDKWMLANTNKEGYFISLDRLPYGTFLLEVKGVNHDGITSEIHAFQLTIHAPYYLQGWFIVLVITLFMVFLIIIFRWRLAILDQRNLENLKKERLRIHALKAELTAIRSQMNPHLIFNSLSAIQTKVLTNNSKEAYEHLVVFSKLLRQALEFSQREYISLQDELSFLINYIQLEFLRKDNSFSWELIIDETVKTESFRIPSLILQPFVENAILHGLMHAKGDKKLTVSISLTKNGYKVCIEDNGIGRTASKIINAERITNHASFAIKAIHERIAMINESGRLNIQLEMVDLEQGTRVELFVNN
jgi:hypothetical protein